MSHYDYPNLIGRAWNKWFPKRPLPGVPCAQPRDYALRTLFDYLAMVEWRHEGDRPGDVVGFTIPRDRMFEEKSDDNSDMKLPCLVATPGKGSQADDKPPLGPPVVWENSYDGKSVLIEIGTYKEAFDLEVWASSKAIRRAVLAGIDVAFAPTGDFAGMSFLIPEYYNVWCWFGLNSTTRYDDAQLSSRRRYAKCEIEMWVPLVHRVPMGFFQPRVVINVDDPLNPPTMEEEFFGVIVQANGEE